MKTQKHACPSGHWSRDFSCLTKLFGGPKGIGQAILQALASGWDGPSLHTICPQGVVNSRLLVTLLMSQLMLITL